MIGPGPHPRSAFPPAVLVALLVLVAAPAAGGAAPLAAGPQFTGVFAGGSDAYNLWTSPNFQGFEQEYRKLAGQRLRLVAVRAYVQHGQTAFVGAWREGGGEQELASGLAWPAFEARDRDLGARGLRLVDLDTYLEGGRRKFLGAWRAGDTGSGASPSAAGPGAGTGSGSGAAPGAGSAEDLQEVAADLDGPALASRAERLAARGLLPTRVRAYRVHGQLRFLAVWRSGAGDHRLLIGLDLAGLDRNQAELARRGLQLVDVDAYDDARGRRRYAGVWRGAGSPSSLWTGDWESFVARWHELAGKGQRLIGLAVAPAGCAERCANQVVANQPYDYGIRATDTHCAGRPGSCRAPRPKEAVVYHWPVVSEDAGRFVRLSALTFDDAPFTLPFSDRAVKRRGAWLYGPGSWHHAIDFSRDDGRTFAARAAAPGTVIFVGWDPWSGNTVIVSHDAGGVVDAYRTIYMHLRDGASHDCEAAWSQTLAPAKAKDKELAAYRVHLLTTGCAQDPAQRRLDPLAWGTEAQTLDRHLLGAHIGAGQFLAWAGDTGPGGKRGAGNPNTHLHVFFAHRDPTDQGWYFFDPYGIYGPPECYPARLTDPLTSPCVRYPVAWKGGRPHAP
jgi:Bacterial tandem repeat domain 1